MDFVCLFGLVCLFVGIKPEKLYSASFFWTEVKPLGMIAHGRRHCYVRETETAAQTTLIDVAFITSQKNGPYLSING